MNFYRFFELVLLFMFGYFLGSISQLFMIAPFIGISLMFANLDMRSKERP